MPLATACALSDSACTKSPPPSDGGAEAQSSCPAPYVYCCTSSGTHGCVTPSSCVDDATCLPHANDACADTTIPTCWLGATPISCKSDPECARFGGSCNGSGVCECQDCEANALCGSATCVAGSQCVRGPGEPRSTCRCTLGNPGCTPPP